VSRRLARHVDALYNIRSSLDGEEASPAVRRAS
jgi:hypothetical protein